MREIFYAHSKFLSMNLAITGTMAPPRKEKAGTLRAPAQIKFLDVFIKRCFLLLEQQLCVACAQRLRFRLCQCRAR